MYRCFLRKPDALFEQGASLFRIAVIRCHCVGCRIADDYYFLFASCDCRVDQVALKHHEMGFEDWDNHHGVFASLRLVDANCVGELQVEEVRFFEGN